jgi:LysR family transcriptional regulator, transcriptional activator of the cysJI operon
LLKTFVTVVETRSFSRAAQDLHLSQSAVSKHIARLETQRGARLIERHWPQVDCTTSGFLLLPHAQAIVSLSEQTTD